MQLSDKGKATMDEIVKRLFSGHEIQADIRPGIETELRSHLHLAAEHHAASKGRHQIEPDDIREAVRKSGNEAGLEEAFVVAHERAFGRAGRRAIGIGLALPVLGGLVGIVAAVLAVGHAAGVVRFDSARAGLGFAVFAALLAITVAVLLLAALGHLFLRKDLRRRERWAWLIALLILEPMSGITYFALGRARSRRVAAEVVRAVSGSKTEG